MAFRAPGSPIKRKQTKIRFFQGLFSPRVDVTKSKNRQGWDVGHEFGNDLVDLMVPNPGVMKLRPGMRKIKDTGYTATVYSSFQIKVGDARRFGVKHGESLDVVDMPEWTDEPQQPFDFEPVPAAGTVSNARPQGNPAVFA